MDMHELVSGLGGAIGSHFIQDQNRLVFVEFTGRLSRFDLIARSRTIRSGTDVLRGTFQFDFDRGVHSVTGGSGSGWDVFWRQHTAVKRSMVPQSGAQLAYLGHVNFNSISGAQLQALTYTSTPIDGSNNASNMLTNGAVFAVRTSQGNYAKVQVVHYDRDIRLRWRTYGISRQYRVLGSGYTNPEDVVVSADGRTAYVTERSGNLLRVSLSSAARSSATVVSGGMTAPHQIWLDEARGDAYLVEFARPGRLLRVDLSSGSQHVVASGLDGAIGLVLTADRRFAYITEQSGAGGRLTRVTIADGRKEVVLTGLTNPFFLTWADAGEGGLLTTERDPANQVILIDLTSPTLSQRTVATGVPSRPSSVAVVTEERLLVCSNSVLTDLRLVGSVYSAAGPHILGVGHVPADRIINGYADTTVDPSYFFQVKDAPFGGTLSLMLNHERAYQSGARYYRLSVAHGGGTVEPQQSFSDYLWSTTTNRFESTTTSPSSGGYYRVRHPNELWYNHWLGYRLNTHGLANGPATVTVRFYSAQSGGSLLSTHTLQLRLDNSAPQVEIQAILHDGAAVGTCGIVDSGSDRFSFDIVARDPEGHLKNWSLQALWGDNESGAVASDSYTPVPTRIWHGTPAAGQIVRPTPADPWQPTNRRCAHTFELRAWARTIDGYNTLHHVRYHKSITIMLP